MTHEPYRQVEALRCNAATRVVASELVAEETPISLVYNLRPHAVMMATPSDLDDFAIGFTLTEGIVERCDQIEIVDRLHAEQGVSMQMLIPQGYADVLAERERNLTGRTGCGLCGAGTLESAIRPINKVSAVSVDAAVLLPAYEQMEARQLLNQRTGAVHAAALVLEDGEIIVREDVGRHNAVDKVFGAGAVARRRPLALYVTSRASYEIVHKAAQMNCPLVGAVSAPTAFAIRMAADAGITLVGFVRPPRLTIYSRSAGWLTPSNTGTGPMA